MKHISISLVLTISLCSFAAKAMEKEKVITADNTKKQTNPVATQPQAAAATNQTPSSIVPIGSTPGQWHDLPKEVQELIIMASAKNQTFLQALRAVRQCRKICKRWDKFTHKKSFLSQVFASASLAAFTPMQNDATKTFFTQILSHRDMHDAEKNIVVRLFNSLTTQNSAIVLQTLQISMPMAMTCTAAKLIAPFATNLEDMQKLLGVLVNIVAPTCSPDETEDVKSLYVSLSARATAIAAASGTPITAIAPLNLNQNHTLSYKYIVQRLLANRNNINPQNSMPSLEKLLELLSKDKVLSKSETIFLDAVFKGNIAAIESCLNPSRFKKIFKKISSHSSQDEALSIKPAAKVLALIFGIVRFAGRQDDRVAVCLLDHINENAPEVFVDPSEFVFYRSAAQMVFGMTMQIPHMPVTMITKLVALMLDSYANPINQQNPAELILILMGYCFSCNKTHIAEYISKYASGKGFIDPLMHILFCAINREDKKEVEQILQKPINAPLFVYIGLAMQLAAWKGNIEILDLLTNFFVKVNLSAAEMASLLRVVSMIAVRTRNDALQAYAVDQLKRFEPAL